RRARWWWLVLGLVGIAGAGAAVGYGVYLRSTHEDTTRVATPPTPAPVPIDSAAWEKPDDLPPSWADRPFTIDRNTIFLVGESRHAINDAAIAQARDEA